MRFQKRSSIAYSLPIQLSSGFTRLHKVLPRVQKAGTPLRPIEAETKTLTHANSRTPRLFKEAWLTHNNKVARRQLYCLIFSAKCRDRWESSFFLEEFENTRRDADEPELPWVCWAPDLTIVRRLRNLGILNGRRTRLDIYKDYVGIWSFKKPRGSILSLFFIKRA